MGKLKYIMHNIILPDGTESLPGRPILAETERVKEMIQFATKRKDAGFWIVDLGAGEGGYSIAFAKAGFRVIAVEPRIENIDRIENAMDEQTKKRVTIVQSTVEAFTARQENFPFNCTVLCLGLLYHLQDSTKILGRLCAVSTALILDTHYAMATHWQYDSPAAVSWTLKRICKRLPWLFSRRHFGLSELVEYRGYLGRWYPEYRKGRTDVEGLVESSMYNYHSFWLTLESIHEVVDLSGMKCQGNRIDRREQRIIAYYTFQ
jgi:16S rRNA G527 N7-methylase RsmG